MWKRLANLFDMQDALTFGGLALVGIGCAMIYLPAGFIAVGFGLLGIGLKWLVRMPKFSKEEQERIEEIEREKEMI